MSLCMSWQHYFNHRELKLMHFACRESLLLCCCHEAKKMSRCQKKNVAWPALIILFFYVRPTAGWSPGPEKAAALREEIERLNCRQHFITAKPARQENAVPQVSNDDNKMSSLPMIQWIQLKIQRKRCMGSQRSRATKGWMKARATVTNPKKMYCNCIDDMHNL